MTVAPDTRPKRYQIVVTGVVQGVGFRPFVKRLADRLGLRGVVMNTAAGVIIDFEAEDRWQSDAFQAALLSEAPAVSRIERCTLSVLGDAANYTSFRIAASVAHAGSFTLTSPDLAVCPECVREILDPADRRFGYAFTNCTNCGPRYSITQRVPYDRANTTMSEFVMCAACAREYADPANRRFHAEPNACPQCGPRLSMPVAEIADALRQGRIVAIKGLGGYQLACDARCAAAIERLRERKRRSRKPFAVMMAGLGTVEAYCYLDDPQRALLTDRAAPIVLLHARPDMLPAGIAPGLQEIGVMLPYTPLHPLLFAGDLDCLVMTSGNISEEPIVISNEEARAKLCDIADVVVEHDRDIFMRVDDSVVRAGLTGPSVLRRARGYAPAALDLGFEVPEVLACGGQLKNTFCLTKGHYAILSQHIGDLENFETLQFFEETWENLKQVYRAQPRLIAHDLHPNYLTTRWAASQPEPKLAVQHHHAHIASCMAEHGRQAPVIGVAFDGTGYGTDGQIWGGEILVCDARSFERAHHLRYVPMIGGDRAVREGWRMAATHLFDAFGPEYIKLALPLPPKAFGQLLGLPALLTSSCGRLFDAIAALTGICQASNYEGEAAMLLEAAASSETAEPYAFSLGDEIDTRPMIREIARQAAAGAGVSQIADAFHSTLASIVLEACLQLRDKRRIDTVCLSGGTFQNVTLLQRARKALEQRGFEVLTQSRVPANDGGLSLGQAFIAAAYLKDVS